MHGNKSESNRVLATRRGFDGRLLRYDPADEAPEVTPAILFEYSQHMFHRIDDLQ